MFIVVGAFGWTGLLHWECSKYLQTQEVISSMCATSFPSLDIHAIASEPVAVNISLEAPPSVPETGWTGFLLATGCARFLTRYWIRVIEFHISKETL